MSHLTCLLNFLGRDYREFSRDIENRRTRSDQYSDDMSGKMDPGKAFGNSKIRQIFN